MTYCPELNKTLLMQHVQCRLQGRCDGLNSLQIATNINAIKAGCQNCKFMDEELEQIESKYKRELVQDDYINNTYIEYLKNFLDSSLIDQQSFCMSGGEKLQLRESLAYWGGFCYTINSRELIFDEEKYAPSYANCSRITELLFQRCFRFLTK